MARSPKSIIVSRRFSQIVIPLGKKLRCSVAVKNTGTIGTEVFAWFGLGKIIEPWQNYQWQSELDFSPNGDWAEPGDTVTLSVTVPYFNYLELHKGTWDFVLNIDSVSQGGRVRTNTEGQLLVYWSDLDFSWGYSAVKIE